MADKNHNGTDILWSSFLNGDHKAFAAIYYDLINSLLSYGKKVTADRELLHDTIQEIFLDLYQKKDKRHTPIINLKGYLFMALKNGILKKIVQNRVYDDKLADDHQLNEFTMEYSFQDQLISREISEEKHLRLQKAIVALTAKQKEIIYLRFEEELEYTEIAGLMNISVESARKQLYRALTALRQIFDNESFVILFSFLRKKALKFVHV
jgi:RNA polymerase sigma factor (sigma-70 family)